MNQDAFGNLALITGLLCGAVFLILYLVSLAWVYADAGKREKTGCMWALIVFFTWPFGLIAYWLLRDQKVQL